MCRESSATVKEGDTELGRVHAGPRRGIQVLRGAPEGLAQLTQRLPELTQGLLGLTQGQRGTERADAVQIGQTLGLQEQFCVEELPKGFSGV